MGFSLYKCLNLDSEKIAEKTHLTRQTMLYTFSRMPVNIKICNKTKPVRANVIRTKFMPRNVTYTEI